MPKPLGARAAVDKEWDKLKSLPAQDFKKAKPKSEVVQQAKKDGRLVHFASLMDICHLKHSELAKHLQTRKEEGRAPEGQDQRQKVDRKQNSRSKGAAASQMTAERFLETISRLVGMAGEANAAFSTFTLEISAKEQKDWIGRRICKASSRNRESAL